MPVPTAPITVCVPKGADRYPLLAMVRPADTAPIVLTASE